ncbi:unnamed protein product [Paramecium pentaurelia]|uniref:Tetratricopeptide repeat protein n=1 Tax=Paramecium pentaurelia TaxID=43138 RepID=A0A8S1UPH1_9CILI|nr:unnamed protein product [Paramecium pentaurelia]
MSQIMREYRKICSSEGHDFVQFAFLNQSCKAMRIYCFQCIQNYDHFICHKHSKNLDQLFEIFKQIKKESEKLIEKIWSLQESIIELFLELTEKLRAEFHFSKSALLEMNPKKLSEALDKVIKYNEFKTVFLEDIKNCSDDMIIQLNRLISQFETFQNQEIPQYNFNKIEQSNDSQDNYEEAIKFINLSLLINPKHLNSLYIKAESLRRCKDYDGAIIFADKALKIDSNHVNSLYTKADSLKLLGDYQNAIASADKALLIDPMHIDYILKLRVQDYQGITKAQLYRLINFCESLRILNKFDEALQILDQALNYDPSHELCLASKEPVQTNLFILILQIHNQNIKKPLFTIEINPQYSWAKSRRAACKNKLNIQQ